MGPSINKVFGQISAMQTLIENFPTSIFNMMNTKVYNSAFEFIIDVLYACGVDTNLILTTLLEKIYGVEGIVGATIDGLLDRVRYGNFEVNTQNPFMEGLEFSIKTILMGLFTSLFTCSALPILPNKVFDCDSIVSINGVQLMSPAIQSSLYGIKVPMALVDIMGMLSISPTSYNGHLYYLSEGKDRYYRKEEEETIYYVSVIKELNPGDTYNQYVNKYDGELSLMVNVSDHYINVNVIENGSPSTPRIKLEITSMVECSDNNIIELKSVINENDQSCVSFSAQPIKKIIDIDINGRTKGGDITFFENGVKKNYHLFLDESMFSISNDIDSSITWGESKINEEIISTLTATTVVTETVLEERKRVTLTYSEIQKQYAPQDAEITRVQSVPLSVSEDSPEYIVCFNGDNPNLLYRSYDMNAFIWYVLNRGTSSTQIGKNQMVWDSRVNASKNNLTRNSSESWNAWYNSKTSYGDEFKYNGDALHNYLYPIMQLEPVDGRRNLLVHIPAQKYFKPKNRQRINQGQTILLNDPFTINSSIYFYDWDYLKNIRILNPKILLSRLIQNMFGIASEAVNSFEFNFTERMIKAKLSSAIKNIIEANDMEVEDCYKKFSNEDFDELINEMLLQRYSSTYNGDGSARTFDVNSIINSIDSINENITTEGTTTSLTRFVTDVDVQYTDGSDYGIGFDFKSKLNSNFLNKLLYAIAMPIIESLFTPQVMLIIAINFDMMGIVKLDDFLGQDLTIIINLFFNKILGLVKSIVLYIKDKIIEILLDLFYSFVKPMIEKWLSIILLEKLDYWLQILYAALNCLPLMLFNFGKKFISSEIDEVDYADIVTPQNVPESALEC